MAQEYFCLMCHQEVEYICPRCCKPVFPIDVTKFKTESNKLDKNSKYYICFQCREIGDQKTISTLVKEDDLKKLKEKAESSFPKITINFIAVDGDSMLLIEVDIEKW